MSVFLEITISATSIASWPNSVTFDIWKRCLAFKMECKWKRYCKWAREKRWKQRGERWWLIWCQFHCTFVFSSFSFAFLLGNLFWNDWNSDEIIVFSPKQYLWLHISYGHIKLSYKYYFYFSQLKISLGSYERFVFLQKTKFFNPKNVCS